MQHNSGDKTAVRGRNSTLRATSYKNSVRSVTAKSPDRASIANDAVTFVNNDQLTKINENLKKWCDSLCGSEEEEEVHADVEDSGHEDRINEVDIDAELTQKPVVSQAVLAKRNPDDASKKPKFMFSKAGKGRADKA